MIASSLDDLESYSGDLALNDIQEEMKVVHIFASFVAYMD